MSDRGGASKGYVILGVAILVVVVMVVVLAPRGEPPEGTLALRRFLSQMGLRVGQSDRPPDEGTFVLLQDLRGPTEVSPLLEWAAEGGRLVVTAQSAVASEVGAGPAGPVSFLGAKTLEPGCVAPETAGVTRIVVRASDRLVAAPSGRGVACFPGEDGAFMMVLGRGQGSVVVLGGVTPLTNQLLDEEDNAVLALQVMGTGPEVVFGPPVPPLTGVPTGSVWDVLPDTARAALAAAGLAALAFALVRGRRLGSPVLEEPTTPIPAGELVRATARLYRNARALPFSARLMRQGAATRMSRRLGFPSPEPADIVAHVAAAAGLPEDRVRRVLDGPDPVSDEDLIALGRDLEDLGARLGGPGGPA